MRDGEFKKGFFYICSDESVPNEEVLNSNN